MSNRSGSDRRGADRRKRQVYHDVERREGPRRIEPERRIDPNAPVVDDQGGPGFITWLFMAGLIFFLYDAFMLDGYWRGEAFRAINGEAAKVRYWSDNVWGPGPNN